MKPIVKIFFFLFIFLWQSKKDKADKHIHRSIYHNWETDHIYHGKNSILYYQSIIFIQTWFWFIVYMIKLSQSMAYPGGGILGVFIFFARQQTPQFNVNFNFFLCNRLCPSLAYYWAIKINGRLVTRTLCAT